MSKESNIIATNKYREKNKTNPQFIAREMCYRSRLRAKQLDIEFNLDADYVLSIWPIENRCPVFGSVFVKDIKSDCASLDRVDNTKGYIKGNVRVISWKANSLKSNGLLHEFKAVLAYMHQRGAP